MTIFNQDDREYLYNALRTVLTDNNQPTQEISNLMQDCKRMNNATLATVCLNQMPNILDDLEYNRSRR